MYRIYLLLLCLLATSLTIAVHADEASDLLKKVEMTVAARHRMVVDITLTLEYKNGKATGKIICRQGQELGTVFECRDAGQPEGTPSIWEVVPLKYIDTENHTVRVGSQHLFRADHHLPATS